MKPLRNKGKPRKLHGLQTKLDRRDHELSVQKKLRAGIEEFRQMLEQRYAA